MHQGPTPLFMLKFLHRVETRAHPLQVFSSKVSNAAKLLGKALAFRKVGRRSTINFLRALSSTAALTIKLCIRSWSLILFTAANGRVDTCLIGLSTVCVCRLRTWRTHNSQKKTTHHWMYPLLYKPSIERVVPFLLLLLGSGYSVPTHNLGHSTSDVPLIID